MTTEELKAWQEANTFFCPGLSARITPDQCDENRRTGKGNWGASGGEKRPCLACEICENYEDLKKTVKGNAPKKEGKKMARRGTCACCGRGPYSLQAKGLCGSCYKYFSLGDLDILSDGTFKWNIPLPGYMKEAEEKGSDPKETHKTAVEFLRQAQEEEEQKALREKQKKALAKPKPKPVTPASKPLAVDPLAGFVKQEVSVTKPADTPTLTIRKNGTVAFSRAAAREYRIEDYSHVQLYHNPATHQIALQFLNEQTDTAKKLFNTNKGNDKCCEGVALLRSIGYPVGIGSKRFEIEALADGIIAINVGEVLNKKAA